MDSIIFDVDGTIWNSTDVVAQAWNEVLEKEKGWMTMECPTVIW